MKVILLNGSPRAQGNTAHALGVMAETLELNGVGCEIIQIGRERIRGCMACDVCRTLGRCAFNDDLLNKTVDKIGGAQGLVLGAPTYYGGISGVMKSFLERAYYSGRAKMAGKVGGVVCAVRRSAGVEATNDLLNFFRLSGAVVAPTRYWTAVYGQKEGEAAQDAEGMDVIIRHAEAMAWLLKMIDVTKDTLPFPDPPPRPETNFIR